MDRITDLFPILIIIIFFVIKALSDSGKKQREKMKKEQTSSPRQEKSSIPTWTNNTPEQVSNDFSFDNAPGSDPVNAGANEGDYLSLDPKYVPVPLPDIDYDKMENVSVADQEEPEENEVKQILRIDLDNEKLLSLRKKLKGNKALRELYLTSVILNKPKALSKWQRSTL